MKVKNVKVVVGGKELIFETGKIARQANGSVMLTCGETMVFASACASKTPLESDFLPMRVDFSEKFSAAGKTLGGFIKREGRPTERETLVCRLIDRPLRPMFADGWTHDTQLITQVFSFDGIHSTDSLAICAASAALVISDIPLIKPIAAVQVGMIEGEFIINPTEEQKKESRLDLMIAGTEDAILMIEGYADFLTEEQILSAISEGHTAIQTICQALSDFQKLAGKEKRLDTLHKIPEELFTTIETAIKDELIAAINIKEKKLREDALNAIDSKIFEELTSKTDDTPYKKLDVGMALKKIKARYMRNQILVENKRCDGRAHNEIRPITIETGLLPRAHGSALFTRGETQAIAVSTLGSDSMAQRFETIKGEGNKRFYLQYFFPPYSVGEAGRMGPAGRREVGHGVLAERSLKAALPSREDFPYTIRLEANITESNGSSSMASVCGGCIAMMNAGVPLKSPIAGIAMGLILEGENYAILSDILGIEDALGDMDFKIAGDEKGITAFQLDIKVEGITPKIMDIALKQAKEGRLHILNKMLQACPKAEEHLSVYAPKIEMIPIHPSKIGIVIGPGGKQIRAITEETGVDVDIDDEAGVVSITSPCSKGLKRAKEIIINLISEVEVGKSYAGIVTGIRDFGLFVKIFNQEGLCHISEIEHRRLDTIEGLFNIGEEIKVKVLQKDDRGKIRLSRKALLVQQPAPADS
ncbi:MAG: polyribonucleotide nucleotidyltransferase [Simkaniaceae bacterium]